jgi:hypothetical protein
MPLKFMTNTKHANRMLDDIRNRAPDLFWVVLVGLATGSGSPKDSNCMWDIAKLVHEQINNKRYVLLEANAVADVRKMEAIHQLCEDHEPPAAGRAHRLASSTSCSLTSRWRT